MLLRRFSASRRPFREDEDRTRFWHGARLQECESSFSFPASVFINNGTNARVTPGTFYYSCGNQGEPEGGCAMNLGQ
jgi:hypothetical protein